MMLRMLYLVGMEAPVLTLRGNSSEQPNHKVEHKWGSLHGVETCIWCGGTKIFHAVGAATPYCMDAPQHKVDAWKADEARRVELEAKEKLRPVDNPFWRKFWE